MIGSANCTTSSHIQTQTLQNTKALFFIIAFWIVAYCCFYALIPFQPKENLKFKQQHTIKNEHFFGLTKCYQDELTKADLAAQKYVLRTQKKILVQ